MVEPTYTAGEVGCGAWPKSTEGMKRIAPVVNIPVPVILICSVKILTMSGVKYHRTRHAAG